MILAAAGEGGKGSALHIYLLNQMEREQCNVTFISPLVVIWFKEHWPLKSEGIDA